MMSSVGCLKVLVCVLCSWLNVYVLASNVGLYSVVAPGSIIPNRDFKVTVAVYHIKEPVTLKLAISGDSYNASQTVDLPTDREIKEVTFKVPDLFSGYYALMAEGVSGIKFQNSISLYYQHDAPVTIILIDKDDYIPGDTINYRVLVLNEQLRPDTYADDVVVCLLDPERNKVDKARKSKVSDGIYSGQFQLSKKTALGQWELRLEDADGAEYGARTSTFTFFYVKPEGLPRFSVQIDTPKFVSIKENEMKLVLRAKHSYGNHLNGRAEIKIKLHTENKKDNLYNRTITAKGAVVKGLASFHIDLTDIAKHIAPIQTTYIATIKAAVEDDDSGEVVTKTTYVYLLENRYIVTCADYSCQRPWKEKDNKVLIRITNLDGSLVSESKSPVKLIYSEGIEKMDFYFRKLSETDEKKRFEFDGQLDKSGLYEFKANLSDFPKNYKYLAYYDISVAYKGEEHRIQQTIPQSMGLMIDVTNAYFTPRIDVDFFLQIHGRKNDKGFPAALVVGDEFRVTLNSNEPIKYFIYNIVARSLILHTERVEFDEPKTVYNFTLKATHLTAPHFNIYAYYVDDQGVLQHTKSQYKVLMSLANEMSISAPSTGHPEEDVKLRIRTEPNSYVGILAIDERISGRIKTDVIKHDNLDYHFYTNKLSTALSFDKPPTELPRNHDIDLSYLEDQLEDVHLHTYQDVPGSRLGLVTMTNAQIKERIFRYFDMDKDVSARSMSAKNEKSALRYPLKPTETWLFSEIRKSQSEVTDLEIKLPDTLGTWIVKGFSLHPEKGLGIFQSNLTQIRTIKPYSLFIHLPYSVKLGETVRIPVLIVNHLPDPLKVELALDNEANGFEDSLEYSQTQLVEIEEFGAKSVFFKFCPKYTGNFIPLDFRATSSVENTTFYNSLMVIEGKERDIEYSNRAILVNLKDNQEYRSSFQFDQPNSRLVQFSLFTDPLGPILHNLDRSIPHGTGELTMSKVVVNFLVWNHLNRTKKLDEALDTRIKGNLREGYQNILNYLHEDGSFSYFDPPKANGSVWLTSYVLRYLGDIRSLIYIDRTILQKGFEFLLSRQHEDGSFTEDFKYFSRSGSSLFLTSSVLLALQKQATPNTVAINKAVNFLRSQLDETTETVSLAKSMAIYALQKSQYPESDKLVSQLRSVAMQENDKIWWTEDVQNGSPQDVEVTSYALLALMASKVDKPESAISTVRWLLAQRNIHGDFESSQKTVVGLTALIEFSEKWGYQQNAWEVSISNEDISERLVACNLLTQTINFPLDTKRLEVRAKGTGAALIQISYGYDVEEKEKEANPSFGIQTTLKSGSLSSKMELVVCVEFVERSTNASNMAVMEVSLPSGYSSDKSSFKRIRDVEGVGSVDTKNEDSVVIVYFESLARNESKCIPVEAYRTLEVTNLKPSRVVIYDNYGRKATEYYQLNLELGDFKGT